jgi:antitoxin MazE
LQKKLRKVRAIDWPNAMTMMRIMRAKIIKIGDSRGIRIPRPLLEQARIGGEVEMEAQNNQIIIRPVTYPRQGWNEAFRAMADRENDRLPDDDLIGQSLWDQKEWEW